MTTTNVAIDVARLEQFRRAVRDDASLAERAPTVTARWIGGNYSRVEIDGHRVDFDGNGPNPMQMALVCLAGCDIDLIGIHAALLGLEIEELTIEVEGRFDVRSYLGIDGAPGPGYHEVDLRVHLHVPGATEQQVTRLKELCERASPVGDTLTRPVRLDLDINIDR